MKLTRLLLESFQGIRRFEAEPRGGSITVRGTNGTGKTTIANAISWLLFDKAADGTPGFDPSTADETGEIIPRIHHTVRAEFVADGGEWLSLKKEHYQVWQKIRGGAEETCRGNTTDYYVNDIPVQKKAYDATVAEHIGDDKKARCLVSPSHFAAALSWQERRDILLSVCGEITEADVFAAEPELAELRERLRHPDGTGAYTVEEYRKLMQAQKRKLSEEKDSIPVRVDEASRGMVTVTADSDTLHSELERNRSEQAALREEIAMLNTTASAAVKQEIAELNVKIAQAEAAFSAKYNVAARERQKELSEAERLVSEARRRETDCTYTVEDALRRRERMIETRDRYTKDYAALKAQEWQGKTVCAVCGQPLPADRIAEARASFNEQRSKRLEDVVAKVSAECSKTLLAELEQEIVRATEAKKQAQETLEEAGKVLARLREQELDTPSFFATEEYTVLADRLRRLREDEQNAEKAVADMRKAKTEQLSALQLEEIRIKSSLFALDSNKKIRERMDALLADEKRLAEEEERAAEGIYLAERFMLARARILDERVNQKFTNVKFRLTTQQVNGAIVDCCDVLLPTSTGMQSWQNANNAARINAGLDIISVLSAHWGITLPVVIDNAESVVELADKGLQTVRLVVDERAAELVVDNF